MIIEKDNIDGVKVLLVDHVPQSTFPPARGGYWKHMIPKEPIKSALILGLGAGTIPRLLIEKNPNIEIDAVDNSHEVIAFARKHFDLSKIKMNIIIDDAFEFVKPTLSPQKHYDYIAVDIWNGYWFPFAVLLPPFIDQCKNLLNEGGWLYVNTPNLDYTAAQNLISGLRDDIGINIIYRWKK